MAEALVTAGADVNACNAYGVRPISLACGSGSGLVVKLLLEDGTEAEGSRPGNFKPAPLVIATLEHLMVAEGISTEGPSRTTKSVSAQSTPQSRVRSRANPRLGSAPVARVRQLDTGRYALGWVASYCVSASAKNAFMAG